MTTVIVGAANAEVAIESAQHAVVSAANAEASVRPNQVAVVSAANAEVAYRLRPERGLALRDVAVERVLRELVFDGTYRGIALREVAIERVLREFPELRGWGVYSDDDGEFVAFSSLGFFITSYSGADIAEYSLGENGRTRRGEIANGEFYSQRQITLTGRIIGSSYSDTLAKTERLLTLLRPSSRAARLGESEKLKLAFFGSERFVVFDVKLSGNFAMPIESRAPCLRDVTLIFTSQDWPFGYDYDSALTGIDARAVFAADSACVLSYPRTEGGKFWRGPSAYPANSAIGALAVSEDWVLIAGNFMSLYDQNALGYAAVYNRNDGTWSGLLRTGFDADSVRSITAAAVRTKEYVFVGAQNGVRYFAFNPLTLQVLHSADLALPCWLSPCATVTAHLFLCYPTDAFASVTSTPRRGTSAAQLPAHGMWQCAARRITSQQTRPFTCQQTMVKTTRPLPW